MHRHTTVIQKGARALARSLAHDGIFFKSGYKWNEQLSLWGNQFVIMTRQAPSSRLALGFPPDLRGRG